MTNIQVMVQKRGRIKAKISRIENYVKLNENNLTIDVNEFVIRESMLVKSYEDYECIQDQLEEQADAEENDRVVVEQQYISVHSKLKTIIQNRVISSGVESGASATGLISAVAHSTTPSSQVKLPNINIPIYSGKYEDYRCFIELFTSLIHVDGHLSKVQKFLYLKSVLKDEPLLIVKDLQITDANYDVALDLLKKRYDNKLVTINCHIRVLMEVQITKGNPVALRDFIVKIKQNYNALVALGVPAKQWDLILVYIMSSKLDFNTHKAYELERDPQALPSFNQFLEFVEKRCLALEALATPEHQQKFVNSSYHSMSRINTDYKGKCACCDLSYHPIFRCSKFSKYDLTHKREFVKKNRLCYNCLGYKHTVSDCKSEGCRICKGRHHSLLHQDRSSKGDEGQDKGKVNYEQQRHKEYINMEIDGTASTSSSVATTSLEINSTPCLTASTHRQILLATAMVNLIADNGSKVEARALLDSGSQSSFITSNIANKLNLRKNSTNIQVSGIGQSGVRVSNFIKVIIESQKDPRKRISTSCGILKRITCQLPYASINIKNLGIPNDINLADKSFHISGEIDLLLGAEVYFDIIQTGLLRLGENLPVLQNSLFGWVVGGSVPDLHNVRSHLSVALFVQGLDLDSLISQFWRLEEVSNKRHMSPEDELCEKLYSTTTKRLESGVFEVRLPIKPNHDASFLGNSLNKATQTFLSLEKRFKKDVKLKKEYKAFIDEYLLLGHAKEIEQATDSMASNRYYLPHHCVIREDKLTTKYRVVFNASMKTTSGLSLNDIMLKGSPVQPDLFDIIARYRTYRYVITSDIQKMYRCIKIHSDDRFLQNIVWRDDPAGPLRHIELQTVTYGTNCAPFLATRTLVALANRNKFTFPLAAETLLKQTYVDDVLGGANTLEQLYQLQRELKELLEPAGFKLHKWNSNDKTVVSSLQSESSKVLGVSWNPVFDSFLICVPDLVKKETFTKREVLSIIAQIFDPMGFISPVIIVAKIIMQRLWALKIEWDEFVTEDFLVEWLKFYNHLPRLRDLKIARWIFITGKIQSIQLIGFSDASMQAYGACLYVRTLYEGNKVTCNLVYSKSRVAPLKTVSLPRLELCGFLLLARMCNKFKACMNFTFNKVVLFTDSQIVLAWLQSPPSRWTTFVANRVSEIQELSVNVKWKHVSSELNTADYISRGLDPDTIINCKPWWEGPQFLSDFSWNVTSESNSKLEIDSLPEQKQVYGSLLVEELEQALAQIFKVIQLEHFHEEISCLQNAKPLAKRSSLVLLNPFLDSKGLLRVGGRLINAPLSFNSKHPIVLPTNCHVTELLIEHEHKYLGYAGPRSVLNSLRQRVWPIHALRRIKSVLMNCIKCHRFKAIVSKQLMGSLPVERTQLVRPFYHVGIDFGGPIMVKETRLRKSITSKAYIALFVCMATKAIHIELVSSLSTDAFLLTLKRFIARRGNPVSISSDNATNFKGANNALQGIYKFFQSHSSEIQDFLSTRGISWKFIPPNSPHWGGLWEAGIKSTKYHLRRVLGNAVLSFEALSTVLAQIEAILNSRPIQSMSNSISDLTCLTPGYFLIGQALTAFPERDVVSIPENRLNMWQHCSKLRQDFWKRWCSDYLNQLQHRPKWMYSKPNLKIGDLVLVKEDNLPPLEWCLARVIDLKPGRDNKVRVVKLITNKGEFTRPITKLCPLPKSTHNVEDNTSKGENVELKGVYLFKK